MADTIKKQAAQQTEDKAVELDIFPLENNMEMPTRRGDVEFVEKLKRTLDVIKVGQSFVIPKTKHWKVGKIFREEKYQHMKMITAVILPEKVSVRIKRVA